MPKPLSDFNVLFVPKSIIVFLGENSLYRFAQIPEADFLSVLSSNQIAKEIPAPDNCGPELNFEYEVRLSFGEISTALINLQTDKLGFYVFDYFLDKYFGKTGLNAVVFLDRSEAEKLLEKIPGQFRQVRKRK